MKHAISAVLDTGKLQLLWLIGCGCRGDSLYRRHNYVLDMTLY